MTLHSLIADIVVLQVLTYIDVSAAFVGVDYNFTFYLVSIANASSAIGRIAAGLLADKFGTSLCSVSALQLLN